jgi:hypothetical protein
MKLKSSSSYLPIVSRITFIWSFLDTMLALEFIFAFELGERGKQEVPGKRNLFFYPLSLLVSLEKVELDINSEIIQPELQVSILVS